MRIVLPFMNCSLAFFYEVISAGNVKELGRTACSRSSALLACLV